MHKKSLMIATLSLGLAFTTGSSLAADLHPAHIGESCDGIGYWHFVNNQTARNAAAGYINVQASCGTVLNHPADKVNQFVQHFDVVTDGDCTLEGASTNLDGRLVLSDLVCDDKPPPCTKDCK